MIEHHTSRRARALKRDRDRSQNLRNRKKEKKAPSTHALNRAIAHTFMLELKAQRALGTKVADANISAQKVLSGALAYLTEGMHGANSYATQQVRNALVQRVARDAPKPDDD
ncbi:hypothetical protein [Devosia elaeis]|uniref:Uncharacterized protein n=1 Tax=Devosia elaeis TaxID=1770058 RepID=A0A178HY89_9HYPH|nr:hypothetical protein [Devosia elaeis]OAM77617.1 hypothetical protein A3840_08890 [Devosia elaeis]